MGLMVVVALTVLAAGCSSSSPDLGAPLAPVGSGGIEPASATYVAIGGIETLNRNRDDIQDNWPQIVFGEAMPPGAVYLNLATEDATARSAQQDQVPQAVALHPTVATVWVEAGDVRQGTAPASYEDHLTQIVQSLLAAGAGKVVLLSPSAAQPGLAGGLADSVKRVAQATGATFVDLGDTSDRTDDPGQRRIADAVKAAIGS